MTALEQAHRAPTILITTLAIYQTEFWVEVGERVKNAGCECVFLSYDDRSAELLRRRGFEVHSPEQITGDVDDATMDRAFAEFGISDVNYWIAHERVTFAIGSSQVLRSKLYAYLVFADRTCRQLIALGHRPILIQEVGGFLCVIAAFFAARRHGIDNWFIEPSFFRGRLFFTKNTFEAPQPAGQECDPGAEVRAYLDATLKNRQIVVPLKDRHHYSAVAQKIVNARNVIRLVQKLYDKHVLGKHQEFGHIGQHVRMHVNMLKNNLKLRPHYRALSAGARFIYYPLHVPADMALTLRAPQYLDQLALIDFLARAIPSTHVLAIKEHPAMIGAMDARRLIGLLDRYDNLIVLPPGTNNYEVLSKADLVVSVNSKSGAEALLTHTPVVVLGDSFYRRSPLVQAVAKVDDVGPAIRALLGPPRKTPDPQGIGRFFQRIWDSSYPGELFVAAAQNADAFSRSMLQAVLEGVARAD